MKGYITLGVPAEDRFTEKKSVFIGNAARVETEEEAIAFVKKIKAKYPDARHNVYAYILRENNLSRFTDDGEPHGTAGMPVMSVLRGKNLVDCAVVVTRYFGGTLLGTGGLVRAYGKSAKEGLLAAGIAGYGIYAFFRRQIGEYLFLWTHFVFFDDSEPLIFFFIDYLAIMGLFVFIGHCLAGWLKRLDKKGSHK